MEFTESYASRLSPVEYAEEPSYYLSHFGVAISSFIDVRIVSDDSMSSGPALQNPLPSVLIKIREGEMASASDIK